MSDIIRDNVTRFYAAMETANAELMRETTKIEDRKKKIQELLKTEIHVPEPPQGSGAYWDACRTALSRIRRDVSQWQYNMEQMVERSEFVNRHEKSILVIAFADVKAGKSTLGNFIAGYYLQDTPYADLYQPLNYVIEDFSKASTENRTQRERPLPFPEDAIEATSAIQHYTLHQGLTWVDTPGLHSLTHEHEELANEYVQFADLVLFLTPSGSPFKEDERGELEKLLQQDKPVMVVITKSDSTEKALQNGKFVNCCVPKSPQNRGSQESYVMDEIRKLGNGSIENRHAISISIKLARQAVKEVNADKFQGSGLPAFYEQLSEILSSRAVALKMQRPVSEVNNCIDQLIGNDTNNKIPVTIQQERAFLRDCLSELDDLEKARDGIIKQILGELEVILPTELSSAFRKLRTRQLIDNPREVRKAAEERLSEVCTEQCFRAYEARFKINKIFMKGQKIELDDIGDGYEKTTVKQNITILKKRPPKGIYEHIQHFIDKDKKFYDMVSDSISVEIGDNFSSFVENTWLAVRPALADFVGLTVDLLYEQFLLPLKQCYNQMDGQLEALTQKLNQLRFKKG